MSLQHPQNRTLIFILIALLATNLVWMGYNFISKGSKKNTERKGMLSDFLEKEVKFSPAQMVAYDSLRSQHRRQGKNFADSLRPIKTERFRQIGLAGFSDSAIAVAAQHSAENQLLMETRFLNNIREIRNICTPEQRAIFDTGFYRPFERRGNKGR